MLFFAVAKRFVAKKFRKLVLLTNEKVQIRWPTCRVWKTRIFSEVRTWRITCTTYFFLFHLKIVFLWTLRGKNMGFVVFWRFCVNINIFAWCRILEIPRFWSKNKGTFFRSFEKLPSPPLSEVTVASLLCYGCARHCFITDFYYFFVPIRPFTTRICS